MPTIPGFVRTLTLGAAFVALTFANIEQPADQPASSEVAHVSEAAPESWLDVLLNLPIFHYFAPLFEVTSPEATPPPETPQVATLTPCSVAPLKSIEDSAAQQLEASVGSDGVVDVSDMLPAAAKALDRFQTKVIAVGGTITLKSAYRPASYQQHLQDVWYKWMDELRNNQEPACQDLRAQVQDEFLRHRLIETQHPVSASDHTRGLAFDALVDLPARSKSQRRRLTLDGLARYAGLLRPAIVADPVHFKYVGLVTRRRRTA